MKPTPAPDTPSDSFIPAILISLAGLFLLDVMGLIVKFLGDRYTAVELSAYRNVIGLLPALIVLVLTPEWRRSGYRLKLRRWHLAALRGVYVTIAQFLFYLSMTRLEYATAATIAMAISLFMPALSVPMLGDRVGPVRWFAVLIGFAGVVMVMGPGSDSFSTAALLPLGAAFFYALSSVTVRLLDSDAPSSLLNLYSSSMAVIASVSLCLWLGGFSPVVSLEDAFWIAAMGISGGSGVLCLVIDFRMTEPSNLAPFNYFSILFAFILGWIFFGEAPFDRLLPGGILIVASGLVIIWRERRARRTAQ